MQDFTDILRKEEQVLLRQALEGKTHFNILKPSKGKKRVFFAGNFDVKIILNKCKIKYIESNDKKGRKLGNYIKVLPLILQTPVRKQQIEAFLKR